MKIRLVKVVLEVAVLELVEGQEDGLDLGQGSLSLTVSTSPWSCSSNPAWRARYRLLLPSLEAETDSLAFLPGPSTFLACLADLLPILRLARISARRRQHLQKLGSRGWSSRNILYSANWWLSPVRLCRRVGRVEGGEGEGKKEKEKKREDKGDGEGEGEEEEEEE